MTDRARVERMLAAESADAGCDETFDRLHLYAELLLGHFDAARRFPRVAVHLRSCGACGEELRGLIAAVADGHGEEQTDPT